MVTLSRNQSPTSRRTLYGWLSEVGKCLLMTAVDPRLIRDMVGDHQQTFADHQKNLRKTKQEGGRWKSMVINYQYDFLTPNHRLHGPRRKKETIIDKPLVTNRTIIP